MPIEAQSKHAHVRTILRIRWERLFQDAFFDAGANIHQAEPHEINRAKFEIEDPEQDAEVLQYVRHVYRMTRETEGTARYEFARLRLVWAASADGRIARRGSQKPTVAGLLSRPRCWRCA